MTLNKYNDKLKRIDEQINLKRSIIEQIEKDLDNLKKEKFDLKEELKLTYRKCETSTTLFFIDNAIKDCYWDDIKKKPCGKYIKKTSYFKVVMRYIDVLCIYDDPWNSGGNEYQLAYVEREYMMCPKCNALYNFENNRKVIKRFKDVYCGFDTKIDQAKISLEKEWPEEIKIYDNKGKLIKYIKRKND